MPTGGYLFTRTIESIGGKHGVLDEYGSAVVAALFVPPTLIALLVLLTRAWTKFLIARIVLAASGRLPRRLMGFLAGAREQQLLRQVGGKYQFRHIRLQERLIAVGSATPDLQATPGRPARRSPPSRPLRACGRGGPVPPRSG